MSEEKKVSIQVENVLKRIENKDLSSKELINYYNNIINHDSITDWEREVLTKTVEVKLRVKFPNIATRILGGKGGKAQEILEDIFASLEKEFDWTQNRVGNRVKVCGSMINGTNYICWYISYKNSDGFNTGFHYIQKSPKDDPMFEIDFRGVGKQKDVQRKVDHFPIELREDAINFYKIYLSQLI